MGRFLTVDSGKADLTKPQSFNRYAYASGDPINGNDPGGQLTVCIGGFGGPGGVNDASNPCAVGIPVDLRWTWYMAGTVREWDDQHGTLPGDVLSCNMDQLWRSGFAGELQ